MACAGTESMLSITGQFDGWQQGIGTMHATVSGKRTSKMILHRKDALYLRIAYTVAEKCKNLWSMTVLFTFHLFSLDTDATHPPRAIHVPVKHSSYAVCSTRTTFPSYWGFTGSDRWFVECMLNATPTKVEKYVSTSWLGTQELAEQGRSTKDGEYCLIVVFIVSIDGHWSSVGARNFLQLTSTFTRTVSVVCCSRVYLSSAVAAVQLTGKIMNPAGTALLAHRPIEGQWRSAVRTHVSWDMAIRGKCLSTVQKHRIAHKHPQQRWSSRSHLPEIPCRANRSEVGYLDDFLDDVIHRIHNRVARA
jgi:hypothetical protein